MAKIPLVAFASKPSLPAERDSDRDLATDEDPLPAALDTKLRQYVMARRTSATDVARETTDEN